MKKIRSSSDVLEQQFGATTIEVLEQRGASRVIRTRDGEGRVLELSFVAFHDTSSYPDIHDTIMHGASIGKAFRAANVPFERRTRLVAPLPAEGIFAEMMSETGVLTVVEVGIYVGSKRVHYATIQELYSPLVAWPEPITHDIDAAFACLERAATVLAETQNSSPR